jgi:hypothetical protein
MSHMIKARTFIRDKDILCAALTRLNWKFNFKDDSIITLGENDRVQLVLQKDNTWMIVGDPYYEPSLRCYYNRTHDMIAHIQTQYNVILATQQLQRMGYVCTENEEGEVDAQQSQIQMVFESY